MSWRLRIVDCNNAPKSKTLVTVSCAKCAVNRSLVFSELLRNVNKQSNYTDQYHCPACLRTLNAFKAMHRSNSIKAIDRITAGASERSKGLWSDPGYRVKMQQNSHNLSTSESFKTKMSEAIFKKFEDKEYVEKVQIARKSYWQNRDYRNLRSWDRDGFIRAARLEHGDKYSYQDVDYKNVKSLVTIRCNKHGLFTQRPSHHVFYGNGCPKCAYEIKISKPQYEIGQWLESLGIEVIYNDRKLLKGLELDIYMPKYGLAIEYHGGFWHSYDTTESTLQRNRHARKADLAIDHGIKLLQIFDVEWNVNKDLVKSMILHRLGMSNRLYARKCKIVDLTSKEVHLFCIQNHIAGMKPAKIFRGLEHNGNLVSVISLSEVKNGMHEVERYCSIRGYGIVGGLSKLLSSLNLSNLFTYADRRYSTAAGYIAAGFKMLGVTKPGYYYWRNNEIYNRRGFQKHKLEQRLANYNADLTEAQNMFNHGYRRIWDAGHYRLEYT